MSGPLRPEQQALLDFLHARYDPPADFSLTPEQRAEIESTLDELETEFDR